MINDITNVVKSAKCLLYADDLKIALEIKTSSDCIALQRDVDALFQWSTKNKLLFNEEKCHVMSYSRKLHPIHNTYTLGGKDIMRVMNIKDLGVTFDSALTFRDHISLIAKASYGRLGFVLRNASDFRNPNVIRLLYTSLVRSKLESSACIWNPYTTTHTLTIEKVQKTFLRYLYKRVYNYFPYMYPTNCLLGMLGFNSLEVRRGLAQLSMACKILHGRVKCPALLDLFCRLYVPDRYLALRQSCRHKLFARPACRTVARAESPVCRSLEMLNALLGSSPECDVFADEWKMIMRECLIFCEKRYARISSIPY